MSGFVGLDPGPEEGWREEDQFDPGVGFTEEPGGAPTNPYDEPEPQYAEPEPQYYAEEPVRAVPEPRRPAAPEPEQPQEEYEPDYQAVPASDRGTYDYLNQSTGGGYSGYGWSAEDQGPTWRGDFGSGGQADPGGGALDPGGWSAGDGGQYANGDFSWVTTEFSGGNDDPGDDRVGMDRGQYDLDQWNEPSRIYDQALAGSDFFGVPGRYVDPETGDEYHWDPTARDPGTMLAPQARQFAGREDEQDLIGQAWQDYLPEYRNYAYTQWGKGVADQAYQAANEGALARDLWYQAQAARRQAQGIMPESGDPNEAYYAWSQQNADYNQGQQAQQGYSDQWHQQQDDQAALYDFLLQQVDAGADISQLAARYGLSEGQQGQLYSAAVTSTEPEHRAWIRQAWIDANAPGPGRPQYEYQKPLGFTGVMQTANEAMQIAGLPIEAVDSALARIPAVEGASDWSYQQLQQWWLAIPPEERQHAEGPLGAGFGLAGQAAHEAVIQGIGNQAWQAQRGDQTGMPRYARVQPSVEEKRRLGQAWADQNPEAAWTLEQLLGIVGPAAAGKIPAGIAGRAVRGARDFRADPAMGVDWSGDFTTGRGGVGGLENPTSGQFRPPPVRGPEIPAPGAGPSAYAPDPGFPEEIRQRVRQGFADRGAAPGPFAGAASPPTGRPTEGLVSDPSPGLAAVPVVPPAPPRGAYGQPPAARGYQRPQARPFDPQAVPYAGAGVPEAPVDRFGRPAAPGQPWSPQDGPRAVPGRGDYGNVPTRARQGGFDRPRPAPAAAEIPEGPRYGGRAVDNADPYQFGPGWGRQPGVPPENMPFELDRLGRRRGDRHVVDPQTGRYADPTTRQRQAEIAGAQRVMRSPDEFPPEQVRWARQVLSDTDYVGTEHGPTPYDQGEWTPKDVAFTPRAERPGIYRDPERARGYRPDKELNETTGVLEDKYDPRFESLADRAARLMGEEGRRPSAGVAPRERSSQVAVGERGRAARAAGEAGGRFADSELWRNDPQAIREQLEIAQRRYNELAAAAEPRIAALRAGAEGLGNWNANRLEGYGRTNWMGKKGWVRNLGKDGKAVAGGWDPGTPLGEAQARLEALQRETNATQLRIETIMDTLNGPDRAMLDKPQIGELVREVAALDKRMKAMDAERYPLLTRISGKEFGKPLELDNPQAAMPGQPATFEASGLSGQRRGLADPAKRMIDELNDAHLDVKALEQALDDVSGDYPVPEELAPDTHGGWDERLPGDWQAKAAYQDREPRAPGVREVDVTGRPNEAIPSGVYGIEPHPKDPSRIIGYENVPGELDRMQGQIRPTGVDARGLEHAEARQAEREKYGYHENTGETDFVYGKSGRRYEQPVTRRVENRGGTKVTIDTGRPDLGPVWDEDRARYSTTQYRGERHEALSGGEGAGGGGGREDVDSAALEEFAREFGLGPSVGERPGRYGESARDIEVAPPRGAENIVPTTAESIKTPVKNVPERRPPPTLDEQVAGMVKEVRSELRGEGRGREIGGEPYDPRAGEPDPNRAQVERTHVSTPLERSVARQGPAEATPLERTIDEHGFPKEGAVSPARWYEGLSDQAKKYLRNNAGNFGLAGVTNASIFEEDDDTQTKLLKIAGALTLSGALGGAMWARGRYKTRTAAEAALRMPGHTQTPIGRRFWRLDTQRGDVAAIAGEHARNHVATGGIRVGEFDLAGTAPKDRAAYRETIQKLTDYVKTGQFTGMLESLTPKTILEDRQVANVYAKVGDRLVGELPWISRFEVWHGANPEVEFQRRFTGAVEEILKEEIGKSIDGPLVTGPQKLKEIQSNLLLKPNPRFGLENFRDRVLRQLEAKGLGQTGMQRFGRDKARMMEALRSENSGAFGPLWIEAQMAHDVGMNAFDRLNPIMKGVDWNERTGKADIFRIHNDQYFTTAWARELGLEDKVGTVTRFLDTRNPFKGDAPMQLVGLDRSLREELLFQKDIGAVKDILDREGVIGHERAEVLGLFNSMQREARRYATSEAQGAMRNYAMRSNLDTALSVIYPYHYWTTHGAPWTAQLATRYPLAGAAIVGATLWTLYQNRELPLYQKASVSIPTRELIEMAPLPQHIKDKANQGLNLYLDDPTGKKDLRIGLLNWYQPAVTNALIGMATADKKALLDLTHPENMAVFAEQVMGWKGRSLAWTGAEGVLTNRRDQLPDWLAEALPGTKARFPAGAGYAGTIARGVAEAKGLGAIPRAVNKTLYGKEFSRAEEAAIKAAQDELEAGGATGSPAALRERAIRAAFADQAKTTAKLTGGIAPVPDYGEADPSEAARSKRARAFFDEYGEPPGFEGSAANKAWWDEHGAIYRQMVSGEEPKDRLDEEWARGIPARQAEAARKKRHADYVKQYGDPGDHEDDKAYWDRYNQVVRGNPPGDYLDEGKVDEFVIKSARDKLDQTIPETAENRAAWQRYADELDRRTPTARTFESVKERTGRDQAKSMWDYANDLDDPGERWDYLHSVVPGTDQRVIDVIDKNGGFYPQEKDPGKNPDIVGTDNLTDRERRRYQAERDRLGTYPAVGTPGSTAAKRSAWVAAAEAVDRRFGRQDPEKVGESKNTGQYRPPSRGGVSSTPSQTPSGASAATPSAGTSGTASRPSAATPSSATRPAGAASPTRYQAPAPRTTTSRPTSATSPRPPATRTPVASSRPSSSGGRGWNLAAFTGRASTASSPRDPAETYEGGKSAREIADAYNDYEARAKEGKADIREAAEIVLEHERSGGNPQPYMRRIKYDVYTAVKEYRGPTRQAGDKQRGAWFTEVKALPDDTKSLARLVAIYDEAKGRKKQQPRAA